MSNHTKGPWIYSQFCKPDGAPIVTVEDVAQTIAGSARHSDRAELFGVTLDDAHDDSAGRATVVCYTGNGPNAHNNARLLAASADYWDAAEQMTGCTELEGDDAGYVAVPKDAYDALMAAHRKVNGQESRS